MSSSGGLPCPLPHCGDHCVLWPSWLSWRNVRLTVPTRPHETQPRAGGVGCPWLTTNTPLRPRPLQTGHGPDRPAARSSFPSRPRTLIGPSSVAVVRDPSFDLDPSPLPCPATHRVDHRRRGYVVQVADRGQDVRVSELAGDDTDVYSLESQLGRVRVSQAVGMNTLLDARLPGQTRQQHAHIAAGHRKASHGAEQRLAAIEPKGGARMDPFLDQLDRTGVEADCPGTASLAKEDADGPRLQIHILGQQAQRFVDAQAAAIQRGDQRAVADSGRSRCSAGVEQVLDFPCCEDLCTSSDGTMELTEQESRPSPSKSDEETSMRHGTTLLAAAVMVLNTGVAHAQSGTDQPKKNDSDSMDHRNAFGSSLAALGDLDGDGVGDLAVGASFDNDGGVFA